jgi:O-antigen/teichoic acid export membrane protein
VANHDASQSTTGKDSTRRLAQLALRGTLWSTLGNYATQLIGFTCTILLTRIIASREVFGAFAIATFWLGLLNVRSKLGVQYAALRQPETTGKLLGTYAVIDMVSAGATVLACVIAGLIMSATATPNAGLIARVIVAVSLAEAMTTLTTPFALALERAMQISRTSLLSVGNAVLAYGIALLLAASGFKLSSLAAISIVTFLAGAISVAVTCRMRLPGIYQLRWQFDATLARTLLRDGIGNGIALAIMALVASVDNYLIGTLISQETLGAYDRAYRIANWPNLILTMIISRAGYLTFVRVKGDAIRLAHAVRLCLWALLVAGLPLMLALVIGAPYIVRGLYGSDYIESVRYLRFLSVTSIGWTMISAGYWLAVALGRQRFSLALSAIQLTMLIIVAVPLTLGYGVLGTLAGVAIAMATAAAISAWFLLRQNQLTFLEIFGGPFAALLLTAPVIWGLSTLAPFAIVDSAAQGGISQSLRLLSIGLALGVASFAVFFAVYALLRRNELRERIAYLKTVWQHRE